MRPGRRERGRPDRPCRLSASSTVGPVFRCAERSPPGRRAPGTLAVNCGSDGWFAERALAALPALASAVGATEVVLLAGDRLQADPRDLTRLRADVRVVEGQPDVSAEVSRARYLITKAGGAPVAEALACGTVPILLSSGVSWEDEALARLVSCGAAVNAQSPMLTADLALHGDPSLPATELGELCRTAAGRLVALACSDEAPTHPAAERSTLMNLRDRARRETPGSELPRTSQALAECIVQQLA